MTSVPGMPLPEIEDHELAARLAPLVEAVVPSQRTARTETPETRQTGIPEAGREPDGISDRRRSGMSDNRGSGGPGLRLSETSDTRKSDMQENRDTGDPEFRGPGFSENGARHAGSALPTRRVTKRGVEFLLPDRVVLALKADAARQGVSASVRLLEILRDAGYPVFPDDFIDLRKLPRRG